MKTNTLIVELYLITNKNNGKQYVGQSVDAKSRWKDHIRDAYIDYNHKKYKKKFALQYAIEKYGEDNFIWQIILKCTSFEESNKMESELIKNLNTLYPNGYNLNGGGNNYSPCEETKSKISKKLKIVGFFIGKKGKDHPNFGNKISDEVKNKISKKLSGDNSSNKKITSEIAKQIYLEYLNNNISRTNLANKYNLRKSTIGNILRKKSWKEALKDLPDINKY